MLDLRDKWVLVTGASSGLGREITRVLAREYGAHVVAVARRQERLEELKEQVRRDHGTEVVGLRADLTKRQDLDRIVESARDYDVEAVVLNAGVTYYGSVLGQDDQTTEGLVHTNVSSLAKLSLECGNHLVRQQKRGGILLVSSVAGFTPMPYQATYGATKAFVTSLGLSLGYELRPHGVSVTVFAPGGIATEMIEVSGLSSRFKNNQLGMMPADICARAAVRALIKRRPMYVPGMMNQAAAFAFRLLPRSWVIHGLAKIYEGDRTRETARLDTDAPKPPIEPEDASSTRKKGQGARPATGSDAWAK